MPPASAGPPAAGARRPPTTVRRPSRPAHPSRPAAHAQPTQQLAALRVHNGERVSQPGRRGRDQLEMELREVGLGPAHLRQPLRHPLLAVRSQGVHLAVRPVNHRGRPLRHRQPGLLQPGKRDVDLPRVHRVPDRAECPAQPRAQLVAVRRLLRQHRQHHFLLHGPLLDNGYLLYNGYPLVVSSPEQDPPEPGGASPVNTPPVARRPPHGSSRA